MIFFDISRAAYEANAAVAIVNIGETRADDFVSLKINARCGEVRKLMLENKIITVSDLCVPSCSSCHLSDTTEIAGDGIHCCTKSPLNRQE